MAIVLGAAAGWWWLNESRDRGPESEPPPLPVEAPGTETAEAHLYFCDPMGGYLTAEERAVERPDDPVAFSKNLIRALEKGPRQRGARSIPEGTRVLGLYIEPMGTAFVDLSREVSENLPGGSEAEYMTIHSIVNTLALNVPEIESVKILVEGREVKTLGGHLDTRHPYSPNMLIVR